MYLPDVSETRAPILGPLRARRRWTAGALAGALWLGLPACSDDEDKSTDEVGADAGEDNADAGADEPPLYAVLSAVFGTDFEATSYVSLVDSLDGQTIDLGDAREFGGLADLWLHEGKLYVTSAEKMTITKFALKSGKLQQEGDPLSFANYGFSSFGFWLNKFVSADGAYMLNPDLEYVLWNPETMEITGTAELAEYKQENGFKPYPGYTDRAAIVRDNLIYQPVYWSDDTFFKFLPKSSILVFDTDKNEVVDTIDVDCPGLDYATQDEAGNMYFSSWVFAPGGAAVIDQPSTCVVKLPAGKRDQPEKTLVIKDVTDGREGGVFRYLGDKRAIMSVLHADNAPGVKDVQMVAYGANWRFWSYDLESGEASLLEDFDWNAGAEIAFEDEGTHYMLVASGDYKSSSVIQLGAELSPTTVLKTGGWTTRMFRVR